MSEENSYLKKHSKANQVFKKNYYDKETTKYNEGVKHTERLLQEGEGLMANCKQQFEHKIQLIKETQKEIKQREEALTQKQEEYTQLTGLLNNKFDDPTRKLKSTKEELRKLRNEKLTLEEYESECQREIRKIQKTIQNLNRRNQTESKQVRNLESQVGKITKQMNNEMEKHSVVDDGVIRLKTYLKKEKETKDKFLQEVNIRKKTAGNYRYINSDTKTLRPIDWNKIEGEDNSSVSNLKNSWADDKSAYKFSEESKAQNSIDESETNVEVSFINFDAD